MKLLKYIWIGYELMDKSDNSLFPFTQQLTLCMFETL